MSTLALATKLYTPPPGAKTIARPRLIERLNECLHHKLTLISAPAGFGKTTLVSSWATTCEQLVAWLSLDEADSDPGRFLAYLSAALQTVVPTLDSSMFDVLQSLQPPPPEVVLTHLINELVTLPGSIVLVLDDYHAVDAHQVDDAMTFLLDHLPPPLHLIITTREDPQFPLSRLRARGHLIELRAADLRFTPDEAATFLNEVMSLNLPSADIFALGDRTEGWIAGLQLAALSMHGRNDNADFIHAFTGSHRFVMDYLVEEVLNRQPASVQAFLVRTSILNQLGGSLCDAVLLAPSGTGQDTIEHIDRANLFLVPLDNERRWYRYHHLFAELLRQRLHRKENERDIAELHRRASVWYEQHGSTADAIRHALAAEDFTRAANLVELAWPVIQRTRQEATALGWLKALPGDLFRSRPVLSIAYVGALLSNGELDGAEEYLRAAEMWVGSNAGRSETSEPKPAGPVVVDVEAFRGLPGAIAVYRAGLALVRGDVPATVTFARKALDIVPEDGHLWRGAAGALLGLASWRNGDLDAAYQAYANGMDHLWRAGNIADVIGGALALADIRIAQGHLHQAVQLYQQALQRGTKHGVPALRGTADMYVGLSDLARERNDLEAATQHLQQSRDLGEHMGFPQHQYRWRVVLARIRQAQGDLDGALALLEEAEHHYVSDFYPNARPVAAFATRVWIAQGRVDDALAWARGQGLSSADQLSYLREFEHITFARLLLARHDLPEVMAFLGRLLQAAEQGGRTGSVIEILVLQALAEQENGDMLRALESLQRAVSQAEPEGYVRLFIDEGPPMAQLLTEASVRGIAPDYTNRLLAAGRSGARQRQDRTDALADVLSPRELDVLHLIIQGCSNREISDRLFLALDTVKGHNRRIFSKLQVESRTRAIARARELGLTEP